MIPDVEQRVVRRTSFYDLQELVIRHEKADGIGSAGLFQAHGDEFIKIRGFSIRRFDSETMKQKWASPSPMAQFLRSIASVNIYDAATALLMAGVLLTLAAARDFLNLK